MIVAKCRVRIRAHRLYISAAVLYQLSCEDPYIWCMPICGVYLNS